MEQIDLETLEPEYLGALVGALVAGKSDLLIMAMVAEIGKHFEMHCTDCGGTWIDMDTTGSSYAEQIEAAVMDVLMANDDSSKCIVGATLTENGISMETYEDINHNKNKPNDGPTEDKQ